MQSDEKKRRVAAKKRARTSASATGGIGPRSNPFAGAVGGSGLGLRPSHHLAELRAVDETFVPFTLVSDVSTNSGIASLGLVSQGSGSYNRNGRSLRGKSLRVRGQILARMLVAAGPATVPACSVRMALIYDRSPNGGSLPIWSAIYGSLNYAGATVNDPVFSGQRLDTQGRFEILKEETLVINLDTLVGGSMTSTSCVFPYDMFTKLKDRETIYLGNNSPPLHTDLATGAYYFVIRCSSATDFSVLQCQGTARFRYVDA